MFILILRTFFIYLIYLYSHQIFVFLYSLFAIACTSFPPFQSGLHFIAMIMSSLRLQSLPLPNGHKPEFLQVHTPTAWHFMGSLHGVAGGTDSKDLWSWKSSTVLNDGAFKETIYDPSYYFSVLLHG